MVEAATIRVGGHYNWVDQSDLKLIYMGARHYVGQGLWYQFERVGQPGEVWCEVRASDLDMFEETKA